MGVALTLELDVRLVLVATAYLSFLPCAWALHKHESLWLPLVWFGIGCGVLAGLPGMLGYGLVNRAWRSCHTSNELMVTLRSLMVSLPQTDWLAWIAPTLVTAGGLLRHSRRTPSALPGLLRLLAVRGRAALPFGLLGVLTTGLAQLGGGLGQEALFWTALDVYRNPTRYYHKCDTD